MLDKVLRASAPTPPPKLFWFGSVGVGLKGIQFRGSAGYGRQRCVILGAQLELEHAALPSINGKSIWCGN